VVLAVRDQVLNQHHEALVAFFCERHCEHASDITTPERMAI
jgi:hypothetical protein